MTATTTHGHPRGSIRLAVWRLVDAARGELAVLGVTVAVIPGGVAAAFGLLAGLSALGGTPEDRVFRLLSALPELGLSLSAGLCAAAAVLADPGLELQLSVPTRFTRTITRRLGVVFLIHGSLGVLITGLLQAAGWWTPPLGVAGAQLAWLAPTLWLMGLGALVGLLTGARSAVAGVLGVWWLAQNLFVGVFVEREWTRHLLLFVTAHAPGVEFWLTNRLWLLAQAAALLALTVRLLRRPDGLLAREE